MPLRWSSCRARETSAAFPCGVRCRQSSGGYDLEGSFLVCTVSGGAAPGMSRAAKITGGTELAAHQSGFHRVRSMQRPSDSVSNAVLPRVTLSAQGTQSSLPPQVTRKRRKSMQRLLICFAVGLGLLFGTLGPTPASAYYHRYGWGWNHHHHHHCWWHHGHRHCRWW